MRSERPSRALFASCVLALVCTYSAPAVAGSGYVAGWWYFYDHNGNYCPSTNACTGSTYTQSSYDAYRAIPNAAVWITTTSGEMIGAGSTAGTGFFDVSWSKTPTPSQIQVHVWASDKDGRFFLADTSGGRIHTMTAPFTPTNGTTYVVPQNIGSAYVGNSSSPDPYFNAFWAAEMVWQNVMAASNVLLGSLYEVEIRGFANDIPGFMGSCLSSCSSGPAKRVQLDTSAGYRPQARVMHELGHVAGYLTHPWHIVGALNYFYPLTTGQIPGWAANTPEWGATSFEEAWATHYGSIAFWNSNAVTPTTCNSSATCYDGSGNPNPYHNIEATSYPYSTNNCVTDEGRWPLSAMRFLWDIYDSHNDADGDDYSANLQGHFAQMLNLLYQYPAGTGQNQIDEPWNSDYSSVTELDGRGSVSYTNTYNAYVYNGVGILGTDNCWPP